MAWAAKNRNRVRDNHRRWIEAHRSPRPPKPCHRNGHTVVWSKAARRWICTTCRDAHQRQRGRELWQQVKADPRRLAAKRARDRDAKRRRYARERALRPPTPSRRQPDGTWQCLDCGHVKPESEFYRAPSANTPEGRCRPCAAAARRARFGTLARAPRQQPDGTWSCTGCGQNLPAEAFYPTATGRPRSRCRECHQAAGRARRDRARDAR
jgi:hypothetical protein